MRWEDSEKTDLVVSLGLNMLFARTCFLRSRQGVHWQPRTRSSGRSVGWSVCGSDEGSKDSLADTRAAAPRVRGTRTMARTEMRK